MYRDNTLIPTEAIRMAALGELASQPQRYADLARLVRGFVSRVTGPSLDLLGNSLELLRYEGLIRPVDGEGMADNASLAITDQGRDELTSLLSSNVRTPVDGVSKLILALKLRYLHLLPGDLQQAQLELIVDSSEAELARLEGLRESVAGEPGLLADWLDLDTRQLGARIAWLRERLDEI